MYYFHFFIIDLSEKRNFKTHVFFYYIGVQKNLSERKREVRNMKNLLIS